MGEANLIAAWVGFLAGALCGATIGLFFHDETWLGGYGSWRRRMLRLGHIAWFGLGLVNIAYVATLRALTIAAPNPWPGRLFIVALFAMPTICYLSAWRKPLRHLFPIPVICVVAGAALFLFLEVLR